MLYEDILFWFLLVCCLLGRLFHNLITHSSLSMQLCATYVVQRQIMTNYLSLRQSYPTAQIIPVHS